ncbi:HAD family phosphatase [Lachnospiraceae bacterium ZAX-1]
MNTHNRKEKYSTGQLQNQEIKAHFKAYPVELKAIFFDMDGLLLDTERTYKDGWLHAFASVGIDIAENVISSWSGLSWTWIKQALEKEFGKEKVQRARNCREVYIQEQMDKGCIPAKPYAKEILNLAREKGYQVGVVSSTVSARAIPLLLTSELLPFLNVMVFGDEITAHKPLPDPYLAALKKANVNPSQAIAAEDSLAGAQAATKAGIKVFLVPDTSFGKVYLPEEKRNLNLIGEATSLDALREYL